MTMPKLSWTNVDYDQHASLQGDYAERWFMQMLSIPERSVAYDVYRFPKTQEWWMIPYLVDAAKQENAIGPYATREDAQTVAEMLLLQGDV